MYKQINRSVIFCFLINLVLLSSGCTQKNKDPNNYTLLTVDVKAGTINLSTLFDRIEPIIFQSDDLSLIVSPKPCFTDKFIFMIESEEIKVFSLDGRFLYNINKKGNGNEEYLGITDCFVNEELNRLEILDKARKNILFYNFSGEYMNSQPIDIWAQKIFRDRQQRLYVYSGNQIDGSNMFKINVFDQQEKTAFFRINNKKKNFLHVTTPICFSDYTDDQIMFFEPFNDTIYALHKDGVSPKYVISYNGENVPESFYQNNKFTNVYEFFQEFKKHNYVNSTYNVIETEKVLFFTCIKGEGAYLIVYDKENKTVNSYNKIIDDIFFKGIEIPLQDDDFNFFRSSNNSVVFFIHPSYLIENKSRIRGKEFAYILHDLKEDDNHIALNCLFK